MRDEACMQKAIEQAHRAWRCGEVPVGAVVVCGGRIIARGHNRSIGDHDPSAHAEIIALREAGRRLGNYRLLQADLYVTLEPCAMCFSALVYARIARLIYGATDPKAGACGGAIDLRALPAWDHAFAVTGGVLARDCGDLLKNFFESRR